MIFPIYVNQQQNKTKKSEEGLMFIQINIFLTYNHMFPRTD